MAKISASEEILLPFEPIRKGDTSIKLTSVIIIYDFDILVPFEGHPFNLYKGQRFNDMVESIRANGVLVPIVVRAYGKEEGKYEILSGHNRVAAAKEAGIKKISAIIMSGLTDDEALLIVTETNLIQRSFADLKHSERAVALAVHYETMKKKSGYRSDLLQEIDELASAPAGRRLGTRDKIGAQYSLGKTTVARYLRVNKLITALKERLDDNGIGMRVAEALSYLRIEEQEIVEGLLAIGKKINIKQADELKAKAEKEELNETYIKRVFEPGYYPAKIKSVELSGQFLSQYFDANRNTKEIEDIITEALEEYFSKRTK